MWEIWAIYLWPKALKSCPKSNKSPNVVTLIVGNMYSRRWALNQSFVDALSQGSFPINSARGLSTSHSVVASQSYEQFVIVTYKL